MSTEPSGTTELIFTGMSNNIFRPMILARMFSCSLYFLAVPSFSQTCRSYRSRSKPFNIEDRVLFL